MDILLQLCLMHLHSAAKRLDLSAHRIVVVDNASRRHTPTVLPSCPEYELIRCDVHHGFAAASNLGTREASNGFLLFLNNDVFLLDNTLNAMFSAFATHADLGICGTRLLFPDGSIQHAGVVMGAPPVGPYHIGRKKQPSHVATSRERYQAVTGACMLVRHDVFSTLGGFDDSFSFGYEDVDLCLRAGQQGYDVRCMQDSYSLHFESMTPGRTKLGAPTLGQFFSRWQGRYTIDG